ncbi:uncharacterized protein CC84DRAFT_1168226 [Paraphaeosphaeria sporulosa]|uniref:Uncharacterized protein n=1 Tax=Paraphaeosphaeria sporulosa TaxID=1460663 RepID=A0A177C2F4_9PLEO|nr:uncharacterized protein CC84DRAFT_1168226 [Paraphaeosphaeria sporulosa]OAG01042.1 hypothetical protein CC84DRAFT_1168226 [Paraphaeosphaeria sporulosa]
MRAFTFLAVLLGHLLFAIASPLATEPASITTDITPNNAAIAGGVYACQGDNFTGDCFWNPPERMRACALLLIGNPSNGVGYKPRSIGPDEGGHCDVFKGRVCNDQTFYKRIDWPGVKNATELDPRAWDAIRCYGVLD